MAMEGRDDKGRWIKGVKQAPGPGRPKLEYSPTSIIRAKLEERPALYDKLFALAEAGDLDAIKFIIQHLEPKGDNGNKAIASVVNIIRNGPELGV